MIPKVTLKYRRERQNKKGQVPIIIQMTYKRKVYRYYPGVSYYPDAIIGNQVIGKDKEAYLVNMRLREIITEIDNKIFKLYASGSLNHDALKSIFSGQTTGGNMSMLQLFEAVKMMYSGVLSESRLKGIRSAVVKFEKWSKGMPIGNINPAVLIQFQAHISSRNKPSSVWGDLKDLKSVINKAVKHNLITIDPFEGFQMPTYQQPKRDYLLRNEVDSIELFADNLEGNSMLRNVAAWFVLGCYSGLRYSDLAAWDESKMVRGNRLYFSDVKTDSPHFIPIYPKLRIAIDRVRECRKIYENQVCNRLLKEIAAICGIDKSITMHVSRHTFAVSYLDNGGSMEVLQKLLGHSEIKTTEIYGKITSRRIEDEVMKALS